MEIYDELGLTEYERKVYESLLRVGRSNALKISEISKVPQTAVYPSLKSLIEKDLVQKFEGEIFLFEAINPKISISRIINSKQKSLEDLKGTAIEDLTKLTKGQLKEKKKIVEIGAGKDFSREIYFEAFEKAKRSILILGWRFEKVGDKYDVLKRLKRSLQKKVEIRLILIGDRNKKQRQLIKDYIEAGIKIRFLPFEDFSLMISDEDTCKITIKQREEDKVSLNILDENFVKFIKQYYIELWNKAETIDSND